TCGAPTFASTLNSRFKRSTITSRCNSPIPAINVWPVSVFVSVVNVGSSSANLPSATPILSWSAFVLGSIATEITGSGNSIDSRITGCFSSQSVSPVAVSFNPTAAAITPQWTPAIASREFAYICRIRPTRSRLSLAVFNTYEPAFKTPEYTRKNVNLPTNGSDITFNANAENGSLSSAGRVVS